MKTNTFDLIVVGANPGGIACAVRAAREGLSVLLTQHNGRIGGMLSNGLGVTDTQYPGRRAPIYSEFCEGVLAHYRDKFGVGSDAFRAVLRKSFSVYSTNSAAHPGEMAGSRESESADGRGYCGKLNFEPHVAEEVLVALVRAEPNITVQLHTVPVRVNKSGGIIESVEFRSDREEWTAAGDAFADCTYEGDLLALAGAPYRVGRESREEFGEQHAGRIFTALHFADESEVGYPRDAVEGRLNLEPYEAITREIFAGSTGEGDRKIQAYTFRLCLSTDPDNRVLPERPANYDRAIYLAMRNRWSVGGAMPNHKRRWNTSNLPGGNWDYPEADWERRREIHQRHLDHALGFLWFLQHDEAVPEALQARARECGLARDEFTASGHVPSEMYVREARRLRGRYVFREQDATLAPGLDRAPIHHDSIAMAEWAMDSHSVSMEEMAGSRREGKFILSELTRPSQVPWRCLLPPDHDNLIVPVCLSSTHVGWGTLRLEPVWMHVGESAGHAVALAKRQGRPVGQIRPTDLQRVLVESGVMVTFFNDFDMSTDAPWVAAVQFLGTRGFFTDYDARPTEALDAATAKRWAEMTVKCLSGREDEFAESHTFKCGQERESCGGISRSAFLNELRSAAAAAGISPSKLSFPSDKPQDTGAPCSRADACNLVYGRLKRLSSAEEVFHQDLLPAVHHP